jgi:polysaccharide export outer membrane protein
VLGLLFGFCSHVIAQADDRRLPLAPNDLIEVKVFQEDDLQSTLRVSRQGRLPFRSSVWSKSPAHSEEAARLIRDALAKDYLVNPQVSVTVTESFKQRFTVLGQVQKPGAYDMPERDALSLSRRSAWRALHAHRRSRKDHPETAGRRTRDVMKLDGKKMASGRHLQLL